MLSYQIPENQELSGNTILMPGSDTYNTVYVYASRNIQIQTVVVPLPYHMNESDTSLDHDKKEIDQ